MNSSNRRRNLSIILIVVLVVVTVVVVIWLRQRDMSVTSQLLHQDIIINADLWSLEPQMLSAGYGFDNNLGRWFLPSKSAPTSCRTLGWYTPAF